MRTMELPSYVLTAATGLVVGRRGPVVKRKAQAKAKEVLHAEFEAAVYHEKLTVPVQLVTLISKK